MHSLSGSGWNPVETSFCSISSVMVFTGNLRCKQNKQERDRTMFQANPESPGNERGSHHNRGLHVAVLRQPRAAEHGAARRHAHRAPRRRARRCAGPLSYQCRSCCHLHGISGNFILRGLVRISDTINFK